MNDKMPELKPCPFCGGGAEIQECPDSIEDISFESGRFVCTCKKCSAGCCAFYLPEQRAIKAWNTRAVYPAPDVEYHEIVLTLIDDIRYIKGIVEKGEKRILDENENIPLAILNYVKNLEQDLQQANQRSALPHIEGLEGSLNELSEKYEMRIDDFNESIENFYGMNKDKPVKADSLIIYEAAKAYAELMEVGDDT